MTQPSSTSETAKRPPSGDGPGPAEPADQWRSPLADKLGIIATQVSPQLTRLRMPVAGNTQPLGLLHGGATAALCENAASWAATAHAQAIDPAVRQAAVGSQLSISHLRPARSGWVNATATAVHLGRRTAVHAVEVRSEDDQLISTALVTNQIIGLD